MKILYSLILLFTLVIAYIKIDLVLYPALLLSHKLMQTYHQYFPVPGNNYKQENEELKSELIQLKSQLNFLEKTKELTEFQERYNQEKKLSQVIIKNLDSSSNFYIIDKGSQDGIALNMPAVYKNCLLGKVIEVHPHWSKIILITDKSCKIAVFCSKSNIKCIHEGQNTSYTTLNFVDHLQTIVPNDFIISSGEGLIFPKGYGLGTIDEFYLDGLNYNIIVKPLVNFHDIEYCYILV